MPSFGYEYELAKQDGVEFIWNAAPIGILSDDAGRNVTAIRCERTDGSMEVFEIPCGMLVKAIGQRKLTRYFQNVVGVEVDAGGRVVVNSSMQTSDPQIFAGGDCVNGGGEAVNAAQMGKLAAIGIHRMLTGETVEFAGAREAQIPV
jgi:glutamate synthase (NADPH/NADH) small chain